MLKRAHTQVDGILVEIVFLGNGDIGVSTPRSDMRLIFYSDWFLRLGQPWTWFRSKESAINILIKKVVMEHKKRLAKEKSLEIDSLVEIFNTHPYKDI